MTLFIHKFYHLGEENVDWQNGWLQGDGWRVRHSNNLEMCAYGEGHSYAVFQTDDAIDFTNLQTLKVEHALTWTGGQWCGLYVVISTTKWGHREPFNLIAEYRTATPFPRRTDTIDVSSLTGLYYIRLVSYSAYTDPDPAYRSLVNVYKVWAEETASSHEPDWGDYVFQHGDGTKENPYQVWNEYDLDGLRSYVCSEMGEEFVNVYFKQMADINLKMFLDGNIWWPITSQVNGSDITQGWFKSHYDGNGFEIRNLKIDGNNDGDYMGSSVIDHSSLFGQLHGANDSSNLDEPVEIKNITLNNVFIVAHNEEGFLKMGGTEGGVDPGHAAFAGATYVAGIAGESTHGAIIKNCHVRGRIEGAFEVGGIVGSTLEDSLIVNCSFVGYLKGSGQVGGTTGSINESNIYNCYSISHIKNFEPLYDSSGGKESLDNSSTYQFWVRRIIASGNNHRGCHFVRRADGKMLVTYCANTPGKSYSRSVYLATVDTFHELATIDNISQGNEWKFLDLNCAEDQNLNSIVAHGEHSYFLKVPNSDPNAPDIILLFISPPDYWATERLRVYRSLNGLGTDFTLLSTVNTVYYGGPKDYSFFYPKPRIQPPLYLSDIGRIIIPITENIGVSWLEVIQARLTFAVSDDLGQSWTIRSPSGIGIGLTMNVQYWMGGISTFEGSTRTLAAIAWDSWGIGKLRYVISTNNGWNWSSVNIYEPITPYIDGFYSASYSPTLPQNYPTSIFSGDDHYNYLMAGNSGSWDDPGQFRFKLFRKSKSSSVGINSRIGPYYEEGWEGPLYSEWLGTSTTNPRSNYWQVEDDYGRMVHVVGGTWHGTQSYAFLGLPEGQNFFNIGGIAGKANLTETDKNIEKAWSYCYILGDEEAWSDSIGGICGHNFGNIRNCYTFSTIEVMPSAENIGGFIGYHEGGSNIYHGYSVPIINIGVSDSVGPFVGKMESGYSCNNCYYDMNVSGINISDIRGTPRSTKDMTYMYNKDNTYIDWDFQSGEIWFITPELNFAYPCFINWEVILPPIDADANTIFNGYFDGNWNALYVHYAYASGTTIDLPETSYVGIFTKLGEQARVKKLAIEGISVLGEDQVGILVGSNAGLIELTYVDKYGKVEGLEDIGSIAGHNTGIIVNCYARGAVIGVENIGGFTGFNEEGTILKCYSTGRVASGEEE